MDATLDPDRPPYQVISGLRTANDYGSCVRRQVCQNIVVRLVEITGTPTQSHDVEGVRVFGLPFEKISGDKVVERLLSMRERLRKSATNILLFHGELLDVGYSRDSYGDDEEAGYMPLRLSSLDGLGFDYVLAGHFHTKFEVQRYDGGFFVYPGSPVSITKKEKYTVPLRSEWCIARPKIR